MLYGWEGNRTSGVTPAMRHRLCGLSTYGLSGHRQGNKHPARLRSGLWHPLPFTLRRYAIPY